MRGKADLHQCARCAGGALRCSAGSGVARGLRKRPDADANRDARRPRRPRRRCPSLLDQLYAGAQEEGEVVWATTDTEEASPPLFIERLPGEVPGSEGEPDHRERAPNCVTGSSWRRQANKITVDVTDPGRDNRVVEEDLAVDLTDIIEELGVDPNLVYSDNRIWS